MVWNIQARDGVAMPPRSHQVRLTVGGASQLNPFKVLIDPNVAASGVTVAVLVEQRAPVLADRLAAIEMIYAQLATWPEGVRYARPGLQAQTQYLAGLGTRPDQKVGRDAVERLAVLKKDYERFKAEIDKLLGE